MDWKSKKYAHPAKPDWLDRAKDYDSKFSWWDDIRFTAWPWLAAIGFIGAIALAIYGLL